MDIDYYKKYEPIDGKWFITKRIGKGAYGTVFEVERRDFTAEKCALKIISIPESKDIVDSYREENFELDEKSVTSYFYGFVEEYIKEFQLMSKLKGNSNIVSIEDYDVKKKDGEIGWDIFIRMELLTSVNKHFQANTPTNNEIIKLGIDICKALEVCSTQKIIHRDIKSSNIFISATKDFKLGDFGVARTFERTSSSLSKKGTYTYMAPEVYRGEAYNSSVDTYSLGIVMYKFLNNNFEPFRTEKTHADEEKALICRMKGEKEIPKPINADEELSNVILKACSFNPRDRYESPAEMRKALESVLNNKEKIILSGNVAQSDTDISSSDKTVGVFYSNEFNETHFTNEEVTEKKKSQNTKNNKYILFAVLFVLAVGLVIFSFIKGDKEPLPDDVVNTPSTAETTETPTTETQTTAEVTETEKETAPLQKSWSSWSDSLPEYVNDKDYDIEEKTLYSSRKLEKITSTTESKKEGWELYYTAKGNSFGAWSAWSTEPVSETSTRDVEKVTRYRYRDKKTTTSTEANKSGWTLYDTKSNWGEYGSWSAWSTEPVVGSDSRKVEKKTQYRYRKKETTESNNSSLDGWNLEYSKITGWGSWSSWQNNAVSASDTRQVETQTVPAVTKTVYRYYRWVAPNGKSAATYNMGSGYTYEAIELDYQMPCTGTTDNGQVKRYGEYVSGRGGSYLRRIWYYETAKTVTVSNAYTQYRYRDAICTYYYSRWSSWSGYSDTKVTATSDMEVGTRTVYRYCNRKNNATYYYYKWSDWSEWSASPIKESDVKKVESKVFYRYRDKIDKKTYYFKRWGTWSSYSEQSITADDNTDVRTKIQYRYKSK